MKLDLTEDEVGIILLALQTASITRYFNDEAQKEFKELEIKIENYK